MEKSTKLLTLTLILGYTLSSYGQEIYSEEQFLFHEIENYMHSPNQDRKKSKEYLSKVKTFSEIGSHEALYYLGMLQKNGIGTKQSFKKSRKSFKRAFELGNSKAAYCLGYYYLKGFGDLQQDYTKAYQWFEKSSEPMAQHWMAKMQFLGLGRESNKKKALSILNSNGLYNSKVLSEQYTINETPQKNSSILFKEIINESSVHALHSLQGLNKVPGYHSLKGDWEGEYFELDWSKNKILRTLPVQINLIEKEGINEQLKAELKIGDSLAIDIGTYSAGALRFSNLQVPIKKQYTDYPNFTHLMTDINDFELREYQSADGSLIIARINSDYPVWQEKANPSIIILKRKDSISKEVQLAFSEQAEDFIRVYPNPYIENLLLNFELTQEANVRVKISNYYNTPLYHETVFAGYKPKGNHTLAINTPPTQSGSYVVSVEYNGKIENKIIIKN